MVLERLIPHFVFVFGVASACSGAATEAFAAKLVLDSPLALARVAAAGARFGDLLLDSCVANDATRALSRAPAFRDLAMHVARDAAENAESLRLHVPPGQDEHVSRFPDRWLSSPWTRFELVGVVARPDRALQKPTTCGELRFVYRLRYDVASGESSRLPMTALLAYDLPRAADDLDCTIGWRTVVAELEALRLGAGNPTMLIRLAQSMAEGRRLEVNVQIGRLAQIKPGTTLEQGHYLQRVFSIDPFGRLRAELLENTVDVERLRASPAHRAELLRWIAQPETLAAIDRGDVVAPRWALAEKAVSVAPYGRDRAANRPFTVALGGEEEAMAALAGLDLARYEFAASPAALLRRLDGFSCQGCHQRRSIAGFHFIGTSDLNGPRFNTSWISGSNYFADVQAWREGIASSGVESAEAMPPPERPDSSQAPATGQPCSLGVDAGFAAWTCSGTASCNAGFPDMAAHQLQVLGSCMEPLEGRVGQACDVGRLETAGDPLADRHVTTRLLGCGAKGICATGANGFPHGTCFELCRPEEQQAGDVVCTPGPALKTFTPCLKAGGTFRGCLAKHSAYALFPACDATRPCRDDYLCAAVDGASTGACMPPYTLPQLVIQFHPEL